MTEAVDHRDSALTPIRGWTRLGELAARLGCSQTFLLAAMEADGLIDPTGHPTNQARSEEAARWMEPIRQYCWRAERVEEALRHFKRRGPAGEDTVNTPTGSNFSSMGQIGAWFGRSAVAVGRELKRLGWRDGSGMPTNFALSKGLAQLYVGPMGRTQSRWEKKKTRRALIEHSRWVCPEDKLIAQPVTRTRHARLGRPPKMTP